MAAWPVPLEETPQLLAGLLMATMAVALVALGRGGRMGRALALYLALAATREVLGSLDDPVASPLLTAWVFRTIPWFDIALPFAGLHLAARCWERIAGGRIRPAWGAAILAAALLAELAYAATTPPGRRSYADYVSSPFILFYAGLPVLLALLAVGFAHRARAADAATRRSLRLAAVAFGAHAAFATAIGYRYFYAIAGLDVLYLAATALATVPVAVAAALLWRDGRRAPLLLVAIVAAGAAYVAADLARGVDDAAYAAFEGSLRLVLPSVLGYTILKHRLFDLDLRIRWTLSRGAVGAVFVGVFLAVTEAAQTVLADAWGWAAGALAAALLFFLLAPIQRVADRLAAAATPAANARGGSMTLDERVALYRDALRDAWSDGALDVSERRMLDRMRERLGLSADDASQAERDVLAALAAAE